VVQAGENLSFIAGEFMTIAALAHLDDEPIVSPITFVLKGATLVTVRYAEPRPFTLFASRAQRSGAVPCSTGEQIMLSLLEALIDRIVHMQIADVPARNEPGTGEIGSVFSVENLGVHTFP
jgi:hypothetical protein